MPMVSTFNNFRLEIKIIYLDCKSKSILNFCAGEYFNLEGDFVDDDCKLWRNCQGCNLHIFVDLKKLYEEKIIREIYDGILLIQKG